MPFVNVIRGQELPDSAFNVRTPILRIPLWMAVGWWLVRGLVRVVVLYVRFWYITGPATLVGWLYARWGWAGPAWLFGGLTAAIGAWAAIHFGSFRRFGVYPALGRARRVSYRRRWYGAMATARLAVTFDRRTVLPELRKVMPRPGADVLIVRMVTGQIPDDYAVASLRLTHTFGALSCKVTPGKRPELVTLTLRRRDALAAVVGPLPVGMVPDFLALPVGVTEDGDVLALRLFGTQILIVGATGAGKGSVVWSVISAVAGGVRAGIVKLWVFDPKGGMELAAGQPLFDRFACDEFGSMADTLDQAVTVMRARTARLRGVTRQHEPTTDEPLYLIVIDELASLTAYLSDRHLKDRIKSALGLILTQGRAVGVHVVAAIQDPRKEVLPFRDLFPTRIALRLSEPAQVDLVLGDGMRDRGAVCDRIPLTSPGVGYLVLDGDPTPVRARFGYHTDAQIIAMAQTYGSLRVIDGEAA
jgi:S-DNA-T family DNA segregation ATPase FtsK/SpoIIIE